MAFWDKWLKPKKSRKVEARSKTTTKESELQELRDLVLVELGKIEEQVRQHDEKADMHYEQQLAKHNETHMRTRDIIVALKDQEALLKRKKDILDEELSLTKFKLKLVKLVEEKPLSSKEIAKAIGLKSNIQVYQDYVKPLLEAGELERVRVGHKVLFFRKPKVN